MNQRFESRREAGRQIASRLSLYRERPDVVVLGLPRGGVPVAEQVAQELHAPLDVMVVRKLGLPDQEEIAFGAVGPGEALALNRILVADFEISTAAIERIVAREQREVRQLGEIYREGREPLPLRGRVVLLVDDGVVTGVTMRAAIAAVRAARANRVVVVAPVIAREEYLELRQKADEVVTETIPKACVAVGAFYTRFARVTEQEISAALAWHATLV